MHDYTARLTSNRNGIGAWSGSESIVPSGWGDWDGPEPDNSPMPFVSFN